MPNLNLKQAIAKEEHPTLTPGIVAEQLAILKNTRSVGKKDIENILHGKIDPAFKISDIKAYQKLAVYRTNLGLPLFPFKLKINPQKVHPLY